MTLMLVVKVHPRIFGTVVNREKVIGHGLISKLVDEGRHHVH